MKIITCASYYGTGSSALTDLISEYKSVQPNTSFEFRFIHDPDGISDLEYHLITHPNREVSGHALKKFIKYYKYNSGTWFNKKYEKYFKGQYKVLSKEYVDELIDLSYKGFWHFDVIERGKFVYYFLGVFNKIFIKLKSEKLSILPKELTYCPTSSQEVFLSATKKYTHKLMECLNEDNKEFLVVDQLIPSSNIDEALRYFDDEIYGVVIDRDPRDVYILCKTSWKYDHLFPHESVEAWCKWFRFVRESSKEKSKNKNILYLNFEDFIYHYNDTVLKLENTFGLKKEDHDKQFTRLNPKRSVVNTQIWKRDNRWAKDIEIIEKMLPEYLYDFSNVSENDVVGIEVKDKETF